MNTIESLLAIDANKVKRNTGVCKLYLSRIDKVLEFPIEEIHPATYTELTEQALSFDDDGKMEISTYNQTIKMILEGCKVFNDERLLSHYNCITPKVLIEKLLTSGEITTLYKEITNLSSHKKLGKDDKEIVEKVKN